MGRIKKESKPFSIRMEKITFDRLAEYCEESGQSKTVAIERAINKFIDDYDEKMQKLDKLGKEAR